LFQQLANGFRPGVYIGDRAERHGISAYLANCWQVAGHHGGSACQGFENRYPKPLSRARLEHDCGTPVIGRQRLTTKAPVVLNLLYRCQVGRFARVEPTSSRRRLLRVSGWESVTAPGRKRQEHINSLSWNATANMKQERAVWDQPWLFVFLGRRGRELDSPSPGRADQPRRTASIQAKYSSRTAGVL
jgi:hypothetical protein